MNLRYFFAKNYWKIFKPKTFGVKVLLVSKNEVLLIKNIYGKDRYYLPGGGVKPGESPEEAVKREIREELGLKINRIELLGIYKNEKEGKRDIVTVFISKNKNFGKLSLDNKEVKKAQWFPINDLPKEVSPATVRRIEELVSGSLSNSGEW